MTLHIFHVSPSGSSGSLLSVMPRHNRTKTLLGLFLASCLPATRSFGRPAVRVLSRVWSPRLDAHTPFKQLLVTKGQGRSLDLLMRQGGDSFTPEVHFLNAANRGDLKTVQTHLQEWDVREPTDELYHKALRSAVLEGHVYIVRELVRFGADINRPMGAAFGMAPLHNAALKSACEMLEELIRIGADPNIRDDLGWTPLFYPSLWPEPKVYKILLRAGTDINARDNRGQTALHNTCYGLSTDPTQIRLRTLLKHGADIEAEDEEKRTPLHTAVLEKNEEAVKVLIQADCNVDARDDTQRTPLHYAAASDSCVRKLLESGRADLEAVTTDGFTPLICAARDDREGGACSTLLDAGANVNATDVTGRTALHWASRHGHEYCVKCLLEAGADKHAKDNTQLTAKDLASDGLHWAIRVLLS